MTIANTQTQKNLRKAFEGEAKAYIKYLFFASQAKKDGYIKMKNIFEETAHNEKEHAKIWYKILNNGIAPTLDNLIDAIDNEHLEWCKMYKEFSIVAREEGFEKIAELFEGVGEIEKQHCKNFQKLKQNIEKDNVFHSGNPLKWKCLNCGHIEDGYEAPFVCPICNHPQGYFEIKSD